MLTPTGSLLKKGSGSEPTRLKSEEDTLPRGACPLFQQPTRSLVVFAAVFGICAGVAMVAMQPTSAADKGPTQLKSQVISFDEAFSKENDWGEFHRYFTGETYGTKNVLTAVAVVQPGKAVHTAHRHAEEEYLIVAEGSGTWYLDGKEFEAKQGDILYVEPWVYHGLTNTGDGKLIFIVVRYNAKGVDVPPKPDDRPNEL